NGGTLAFGPDRYLYISVGDDEGSDRAQDLGSLVGKILRIDVRAAERYMVPSSNPFAAETGARGEIWSYGFRNPWRFSFDRGTGDMWIGEVGEATAEEIDHDPAGRGGGANYGWPYLEGDHCQDATRCNDPSLVPPVVVYDHNMNCAVIG